MVGHVALQRYNCGGYIVAPRGKLLLWLLHCDNRVYCIALCIEGVLSGEVYAVIVFVKCTLRPSVCERERGKRGRATGRDKNRGRVTIGCISWHFVWYFV